MKDSGRSEKISSLVFPVLSLVLWIATIVLFFKSNGSYSTNDYEAQRAIEDALRWHPACCVGAIVSTAAAYVVSSLRQSMDREEK